jgi:glucokinase
VVVMGTGDIPIWVMDVPRAEWLTGQVGTLSVDFKVPAAPPVNGGFFLAAGVVNQAGKVLAGQRFKTTFLVKGAQRDGIVDVPYSYHLSFGS